jgi:F-type H+-transporting ATPase subunit a
MLKISLAAERIGFLFGLPITNSLLATWLTMVCLFIFAYFATRKMSLRPSGIQSVAEMLVGGLYDFFSAVTGHHIAKFFPLLASLFLFIITANWIGLLPGVGTVGVYHTAEAVETVTEVVEEKEKVEFIPLLRAATADLNMTVGLAIVAVFAIQYFGFSLVGFHYSSRFLSFKDPMAFVMGILEILSETSKVISFAFRLFGNIFAGEVLLAVLAFLMPFIVPLPFLMMELFVGFIQALVFSMLTAVFLNVAVSHGEAAH